MNITCPQCNKSIFVMNSLAGKKVKCQCGAIVAVPAAQAPAGKPMFKPGSLKLPPKPQLKPGLKLASGITSAAPAPAPAPAPVPAPAPEEGNGQAARSTSEPDPALEPVPAPEPVPAAEEGNGQAARSTSEPAPALEPASAPEPVAAPLDGNGQAARSTSEPAPAAAAPVADLATRLGKLKALLDMGAITAEEHAEQRARILSEI